MGSGNTIINKVIFKVSVDSSEAESALTRTRATISKHQSEFGKTLTNIGNTTRNVGLTMTLGLTVPLVKLGEEALQTGMKFEQGLKNIQAVTEASADEMDRFAGIIRKMAKETPYSVGEVSLAIEELSKAGLTTTQIMEGGLYGSLTLAAAGEIGLGEAANLAARALITFSKDGLSVEEAANIIVGAANKSTTSVGELGSSFEMVAVVAAGAGMTLKDVSTGLAVFAQHGMAGSDAGTSLKTMLMNLNPQTDKAADLMKELGIITEEGKNQFYDEAGVMKDLAGIAQVTQDAFKGLSDEERQHAMRVMFGMDAIRGANVLYQEGAEGIRKMADAIATVSARDVAEKRWESFSNKLKVLKNRIADVGITLFERLQPALVKIVDWVGKLVNKFDKMSPVMQNFIGIALAVVAALGPVLVIFGTLASNIGSIITLFGALGGAAGIISGIASAFAFLANPLAIATIAIFGVGQAFYVAQKKQEKAIKDMTSDLDAYSMSTEDFMQMHSEAVKKASEEDISHFGELSSAVQESIDKIKLFGLTEETFNAFTSNLSAMVEDSKVILGQNTQNILSSSNKLFTKYNFMTAESESEALATIAIAGKAKASLVEENQKSINDIVAKANKEKRDLNAEEVSSIQKHLSNISKITVESTAMSKADVDMALSDIQNASSASMAKSVEEFLKINKERTTKTVENAKLATSEELGTLQYLKDQGIITANEYTNGRIAALNRYQDAVRSAQAEEYNGLGIAKGNLKQYVKDTESVIKANEAEMNSIDSTSDRFKELKEANVELTLAQDKAKDKVADLTVAMGEYPPEVKKVADATRIFTETQGDIWSKFKKETADGMDFTKLSMEQLKQTIDAGIKDGVLQQFAMGEMGSGLIASLNTAIENGEPLSEEQMTQLMNALNGAMMAKKAVLEGNAEGIALGVANGFISTRVLQDAINAGNTLGMTLGQALQSGFAPFSTLVSKVLTMNGGVEETPGNYKARIDGKEVDVINGMVQSANGNILRKGVSLVGEAGPELLTVGPSGTHITPLTGSQKARNVDSAFGGNNITVNVDGGWDNADRIAQRVAGAMDNILGGKLNVIR